MLLQVMICVIIWTGALAVLHLRLRRNVPSWMRLRVERGWIHWDVTCFNAWPATIVRPLLQGKAYKLALFFYDAGILVAGAAMMGGIGIVLVTCSQLWNKMLMSSTETSFHKRSEFQQVSSLSALSSHLDNSASGSSTSSTPLWLTPLIPGVNMPLRHVLPLFLVGVVSQVTHEAGHAIAAALHQIRPLSMGLWLVFPGVPIAYVSLPDLGACSMRTKWRIISAGVWHNAMVLGFCALVHGLLSCMWTDTHGLHVHTSGALHDIIPRGSRITALNDLGLENLHRNERMYLWNRLVQDVPMPAEPGWCIPSAIWLNATDECCRYPNDTLACFQSAKIQKCLRPMYLFDMPQSVRCRETCDAGVCAVPDPHAPALVRVGIDYGAMTGLVVLRGPFRGLSQSMHVSTHTLRAPWSFLIPPTWVDALLMSMTYVFQLVSVVNSALLVLNMLPIPTLDGSLYLRLCLQQLYIFWSDTNGRGSLSSCDIEDPGEAVPAYSLRRLDYIQSLCEMATCIVTGIAFMGSILTTLAHT